jgi:hypothetical protein
VQRLKNAFRFIQASYRIAIENPQLQKPWFRLALIGFCLLVIWLLPIILVVSLIGFNPAGLFILGLLIILGLISLLILGEIIALDISKMFYNLIREPSEADSILDLLVEDRSVDGVQKFFAVPGLRVLKIIRSVFKTKPGQSDEPSGYYLVSPLIANENLSFKESLNRMRQIFQENRLRFQPGLIPVESLSLIIQWILILAGIVIAFIVGLNIADPMTPKLTLVILATVISSIIGLVFALLGIHFKTFIQTCYFTALYCWVRNVEAAALDEDPDQAHPPLILGQALGRMPSPLKED